jgi:hypothetical protein
MVLSHPLLGDSFINLILFVFPLQEKKLSEDNVKDLSSDLQV